MELKQNTTIIVLGASGDLAKKKTVGASFLLGISPPWFVCANLLLNSTPRSLAL